MKLKVMTTSNSTQPLGEKQLCRTAREEVDNEVECTSNASLNQTPKEVRQKFVRHAPLVPGPQEGVTGTSDTQEDGTEQRIYMAFNQIELAEKHHPPVAEKGWNLGREVDSLGDIVPLELIESGVISQGPQNPQMNRGIIRGDLLGKYLRYRRRMWFVQDEVGAKVWLVAEDQGVLGNGHNA